MTDRHSMTEMIGEGLREAGVLVAVFGMLDKFVHGEGSTDARRRSLRSSARPCFRIGCR
jgi:hypothetical protein